MKKVWWLAEIIKIIVHNFNIINIWLDNETAVFSDGVFTVYMWQGGRLLEWSDQTSGLLQSWVLVVKW